MRLIEETNDLVEFTGVLEPACQRRRRTKTQNGRPSFLVPDGPSYCQMVFPGTMLADARDYRAKETIRIHRTFVTSREVFCLLCLVLV